MAPQDRGARGEGRGASGPVHYHLEHALRVPTPASFAVRSTATGDAKFYCGRISCFKSAPGCPSDALLGLTLVELVLVMTISAIVFAATPPLVLQGVRTMVFLPKAIATNQVAMEVVQQVIEGGFSTLPGQASPIRGLRFAVGQGAGKPAIWLAEAGRIGFLTSDGRSVLIRLDSANHAIKRSLLPVTTTCSTIPEALAEEIIPYQALGSVQITTAGALFQYYNQSGGAVAPSCPPSPAIRRVAIAFAAQTGNGVFDEGNAREAIASSVAIRLP